MEKLTQTLTSLRLLYRDNAASEHLPTPHQAEMQGYLLFSNIQQNLLQSYTSLPPLSNLPPVQFALSCYNAMKEISTRPSSLSFVERLTCRRV